MADRADERYALELNEAGTKCADCGEVGWAPGAIEDAPKAAIAECSYCGLSRRPAIVPVFDAQILELRRQAANAARRNKPTMWAYFTEQADGLALLAMYRADEHRLADALRDLTTVAVAVAPVVSPRKAAHVWAQGIYARKILAAAGRTVPAVSLGWLRARVSDAGLDLQPRVAAPAECPNCGCALELGACSVCVVVGAHDGACYHGDQAAGDAVVARLEIAA